MILKTSEKGIEFIKEVEGLSLKAYKDTGGVLTIGYGHVVQKGESSVISKVRADAYLRQDIAFAEKLVNRYIITKQSNQDQYDALVSFAYNLGRQGFINKDGSWTGITRKHNAGLFGEVPSEFRRWIYDDGKVIQGLVNRREKEVELYTGVWK